MKEFFAIFIFLSSNKTPFKRKILSIVPRTVIWKTNDSEIIYNFTGRKTENGEGKVLWEKMERRKGEDTLAIKL